jgi:hypothetical protein
VLAAAVVHSMATAAADVQAVLQEALRAQEHEDEGEVSLALDSYYRASCQLNYFVDLHAEKGCALAELCEGLVHLYEQRMTVSGKIQAACCLDDGRQCHAF